MKWESSCAKDKGFFFERMYLERAFIRREIMQITMKELPLSEKPYEKCLAFGTEKLSDAENAFLSFVQEREEEMRLIWQIRF